MICDVCRLDAASLTVMGSSCHRCSQIKAFQDSLGIPVLPQNGLQALEISKIYTSFVIQNVRCAPHSLFLALY